MRLVIDILEEDYKGICHLNNEQLRMLPVEVAETLIRIANGIPIPDNATNGDVLKAMFPNIEVEEQGKDLFIVFNMDIQGTPFYKAWWNAPYQKGGKE
jgi:hypothetical protein